MSWGLLPPSPSQRRSGETGFGTTADSPQTKPEASVCVRSAGTLAGNARALDPGNACLPPTKVAMDRQSKSSSRHTINHIAQKVQFVYMFSTYSLIYCFIVFQVFLNINISVYSCCLLDFRSRFLQKVSLSYFLSVLRRSF